MTQNWSLSVIATESSALPRANWALPEELEDMFGFKRAYYNPQDRSKHAKITGNIGFYAVIPQFPENPVCEMSKERIRMLVLVPLLPLEAQAIFHTQGLEGLIRLAVKVYDFAPAQSAAA